MIVVKNRLIFGIIYKVIKFILKIIYKVFAFFNLVYTCFFVVLGLVLYVCGVFDNNTDILVIFYVFIGLSVVYAIVKTILSVVKFKNKLFHKDSKNVDTKENLEKSDINENKEDKNQLNDVKEDSFEIDNGENDKSISNQVYEEKPKYYYVKQNHNYVVADFSDRVELLLITEQGFKKVKTEYK